jgi:hypothetical protein
LSVISINLPPAKEDSLRHHATNHQTGLSEYVRQSERGERFAERVMTAVRTARKQGKDVLDFLVRSVTAHTHGTPPPRLLSAGATA